MSNVKSQIFLAFDPGLSHIGIAVSHEGKLAQPLATIEAHNLINQIKPLIEKYRPDVIVIGQPDPGPVADLAIALEEVIGHFFTGKIVLHSEDLTSQEASKKMVEGGMAKHRRQQGSHAAAAALILQDYLDSRSNDND